MSDQPFVSIIMPMYNEAEAIASMLAHLTAVLARKLPQATGAWVMGWRVCGLIKPLVF